MSLPSPATQLPDRIGPFAIRGVLGKGGMGVVFDARAPNGHDVALKVVRPVGETERANLLLARFAREAKILEQLDHPGIVRLVGSGSDGGLFYLAMERIEGVSLLTIRRKGALDFSPLVELGVHLADALAHMHAVGVVHRDIKPANILIGAKGRPVITDFGISGLSDATGITRTGDLLGSPGFMAPEVMEGETPSPASDLFALGRLMFELGARGPAQKLPKNAPIMRVLAAAMTIDWDRFPTDGRWPELRPIVERLLSEHPPDRFAGSAEAVTTTLGALLDKADVLDAETLSEQVEKMALRISKSWEVLADDLDLPSDELDGLHLPAGERAAPRVPDRVAAATSEMPPSFDERAKDAVHAPGAVTKSLPSRRMPVDDFDGPTQVPSGPRVARVERAEDTKDELPAFDVAATPLPDDADVTLRPPGPDRRSNLPRPGDRTDDRPAVPLQALLDRAAEPFTPFASAGRDRRSGPSDAPLERQLQRVRQERQEERMRTAQLRASRLRWRVVAVAALAVGIVAGILARPRSGPPPSLVLVPSRATPLGAPKSRPDPDRVITEADRTDAREMLAAAEERLTKRDLEGAERLLGLCIDVADLPGCHKRLATMLTLIGEHGRARFHYEHFLDTAPGDPDAPAIRRVLRE